METNQVVVTASGMSTYEEIAVFLSIVAILIPIIQWAWKKWITKPVLNHLSTGRAFLFINRSGSYIKIESVYEAQNKSVSIKNINLNIIRVDDGKALNLCWSTFESPVNQRIVGNFATATEIAHPFRIEENSIMCAFTEFSDFNGEPDEKLKPFFDALDSEAQAIRLTNLPFNEALVKYRESEAYKNAKQPMNDEFFWNIGKYVANISATYNKNSQKVFECHFQVDEKDYSKLKFNLEESLVSCLKIAYGIPCYFQPVKVEIQERCQYNR